MNRFLKFIVILVILADINGLSRLFNSSIIEELKAYGDVASINYRVSIKGKSYKENEKDLRLKIWVCAHISKTKSNEILFTIMRLDNMMDFNEKSDKRKFDIDYIWKDITGWNVPLNIWIKNIDLHLDIPLNPNYDIYQMIMKNINLIKSPITTTEIPKVIYYNIGHYKTKTIAPILEKTSSTVRILNPHYLIKTITIDLFSDFMFEKEGNVGRDRINSIQPIAYKTDLYRLVQIYYDGGIYLDTKLTPIKPFDEILPKNGSLFIWERNKTCITNAFFASPKRNIYLRNAINQIYKNIQLKYYGVNALAITGPYFMLKVFKSLHINDKHNLLISGNLNLPITQIRDDNNEVLIQFHNGEYRRSQSMIDKCRYTIQWKETIVFYEKVCNRTIGILQISSINTIAHPKTNLSNPNNI